MNLSATITSIRITLPLHQARRSDLEFAGGKAANLGELSRLGWPVPPGFVVTTTAYEYFVLRNGLQAVITRALEAGSGGAEIREAFLAASVPEEIERELLRAWGELGGGPVAVRSSAPAEDLPGASFAGQQDTYLNVTGSQQLLEAVRACWASLWTDRAIAYRQKQGIDQAGVRLAVLVQRMVPAESAGVMFSANPVSGRRDEVLIEASPGLGEAVVSGLVTPDHFLLRRSPFGWRIVERQTGKREVVVQALPGGGTRLVRGSADNAVPSLPDYALRSLARRAEALQRYFGAPQDIEWAWAGGRLYILQARPLTGLPAAVPQRDRDQRLAGLKRRLQTLYANNFVEMLPQRPYPLDLDTWLPAVGSAVEPVIDLLGLDWRLLRLFAVDDGVVLHYRIDLPRPTWRLPGAPLRLMRQARRYNPLKWEAGPLLAETLQRARELRSRSLADLSWDGLLETLHEAAEIPALLGGELRRRFFPAAALAVLRLKLFLAFLGGDGSLAVLLSGAKTRTLEMNAALEDLAADVRRRPELAALFASHSPRQLWDALPESEAGREFLTALQAFLDQYGHRETMLHSALAPTWADAPEVALAVIKTAAAAPLPPQDGGVPAWQAARDAVLAHPLLGFRPLRERFLNTLEAARTLVPMREDTHFYAALALPVFRRTILEMGRRLVDADVLETSEDVFHLRLAELESLRAGLDARRTQALRAAARRRKQRRQELEGTPLVEAHLLATGHSPDLLPGDVLLQGTPGSPGVAEGPARIVRSMDEFDRLGAGEVLVAPYTNPTWTPLFQRAAAVVVDTGSPASHAAIVAREYGIPAVTGTVHGTRTLQDGEFVRVDGSRGVVSRVTAQENQQD